MVSETAEIKQLTKSECKKLANKMLGYGKRTAAIKATGIDGTTLDKAKDFGVRLSEETLNGIRDFINDKQTA